MKKRVISMIVMMILFVEMNLVTPIAAFEEESILPVDVENDLTTASDRQQSVASVAFEGGHCMAISQNGDLYCWGRNDMGQIGNGRSDIWEIQSVPIKVLENVKSVAAGEGDSAAIDRNGDLYCWGRNDAGQVGNGTTTEQTVPVKVLGNVKSVVLEGNHSAAVCNNGDLYCWGRNGLGQVGNGTKKDQITPVKILGNIESVILDMFNGAAISKNGELYCWGANYSGQVGNGTTTDQTTPVKVLENVKSVAFGLSYTVAVCQNGDLYCWGSNGSGQVGNGITVHQTTPVKVLGNVESIALYGDCNAAVCQNGELYCWGSNSSGEVGNGTTENQAKPVKVLENVLSVTLYGGTAKAINKERDLYAWGWNAAGQVGNGTTEMQTKPVKILANIASAEDGSAAISKDGELYCWGFNDAGQVGNGTKEDQLVPVKVLENVAFVGSASDYSISVNKNGELYCWGNNDWGQIGNGTKTEQLIPLKVLENVRLEHARPLPDEGNHILSTIPENDFMGAMRWGENFSIKFDKALDGENPLGDGTIKFHDKATGEVLLEVGSGGESSSVSLLNIDGAIKITIADKDALPNDRDIFVTLSENIVKFADGTCNRAYPDENFWNFHTFPVDTPSVTNSAVSKEIPLEKYRTFFNKPLMAELCQLVDNGTKGICFGMCYSAIAWKEYYGAIHKIVDNKYLSQADVNRKSVRELSLLDYMQYGQVFQQTPKVQQTKDTDVQSIEKKIRNYLNGNGEPVILGVRNDKGGHALLPVRMEEKNGIRIWLYNCNSPTTNYYLDVRKMISGEWLEWEIKGINYANGIEGVIYSTMDDIWCVTVDSTCDSVLERRFQIDEKYYLLMTKLDSIIINKEEKYQGNKGNGKTLIPISYVSGEKTSEDYNMYWTEENNLTIDSDGEVWKEVILCEGNREYRISADIPAEVSMGLKTGADSVSARLKGSGKVSIQNNVVIDDIVQSVTMEGQSNTGKVEVSEKNEGYAVKGMQNLEIVQQSDEGESSLNVKNLNDSQVYQVVVDGDRVSVGEDTNGDGTMDKVYASNNGRMKQSITGTPSYSKTYGCFPFNLDAALKKGNGTLSYTSSNPKVAEVSDRGEVNITGSGEASITITASETEEYKKCKYKVSINVAKANQRINGTAKYSKVAGSKSFCLNAKRTVGDGKLSYLSSNHTVATVSGNGTVTIKKPGSTIITVTAAATANYNACTFRIKLSIDAPKKGTTLTNPKTKTKYKVTKKGKSVEYAKPKDKKVTKVSVPATVTISGVKYNVTAIGSNAFSGCKKLKSITIGKNVESIGTKAFASCTALGKLALPAKASKIGKQAFANCSKLKDITIQSTKLTAKSIGAKAFQGIHAKATIKVPKAKRAAYQKLLKSKGIGKKVKVK